MLNLVLVSVLHILRTHCTLYNSISPYTYYSTVYLRVWRFAEKVQLKCRIQFVQSSVWYVNTTVSIMPDPNVHLRFSLIALTPCVARASHTTQWTSRLVVVTTSTRHATPDHIMPRHTTSPFTTPHHTRLYHATPHHTIDFL